MPNVTMNYRIEAKLTGNINCFVCLDSLNNVVGTRKSRREYKYCVVVKVLTETLIDNLNDIIDWCNEEISQLADTDSKYRQDYERRIQTLTADIKRLQAGLYTSKESGVIIPHVKSWHKTFDRAQQHARKIEKGEYYEMIGIATI